MPERTAFPGTGGRLYGALGLHRLRQHLHSEQSRPRGVLRGHPPVCPWGQQRSYSAKIMDIVEGKRMDLRRIEERFLEADRELGPDAFLHACYFIENPCYDYVRYWDIAARMPFWDSGMLRGLVVETEAIAQFSDAQREAISRRWGQAVYAAVCEASVETSLPA